MTNKKNIINDGIIGKGCSLLDIIDQLKIRFVKFFNNNVVGKEDDGYWVHFYRSGIGGILDNYDGKYKICRTHNEIKELIPKLSLFLEKGMFTAFKVKNESSPMLQEYADTLPPIFVYVTKKQKEGVEKILLEMGLADYMWIDDNKSAIEWEKKQTEDRWKEFINKKS